METDWDKDRAGRPADEEAYRDGDSDRNGDSDRDGDRERERERDRHRDRDRTGTATATASGRQADTRNLEVTSAPCKRAAALRARTRLTWPAA